MSTEDFIKLQLDSKKGLVALLTRRKRYNREVLRYIDRLIDKDTNLERRVSKLEREKAAAEATDPKGA